MGEKHRDRGQAGHARPDRSDPAGSQKVKEKQRSTIGSNFVVSEDVICLGGGGL